MDTGRTASPLALLAAAFEDGTDLLSQAVAVLRARPDPFELAFYGVDDPADLPVGAADRRLLAAYEDLRGAPLDVTVRCDACGALTTLLLTSSSVGRHVWASTLTGDGGGLREPSYADLLAAAREPAAILDRCRLGAAQVSDETGASWADLDRAEQSLAGPLRSACAECGEPVVADVDVVPLVLRGLAVACAELDREVHLLASTYGWDLPTIESLPDQRRQRLAALVSGVA
ncbi:hypothetical protein [Nostocoides sp. HKS02]|uniref:hypothetical protein n=1 Tax=Nostocoides sp. HKS02 TaxID=1813880 RepID=UPI0012B45BC4|nr:hypothetical protein [Tetrasphaera sp. HKS02]QGN56741.1 hypothetical protein GKE56_01180 [Tetrasphaera sp. HKS02]